VAQAIELKKSNFKTAPCKEVVMGAGAGAHHSPAPTMNLDGHYFTFPAGSDPTHVVDRYEVRQRGNTVTYFRNGPVGCTGFVDSATAKPMESYTIQGRTLHGPVTATVLANGDISYSHGYISRKEGGTSGMVKTQQSKAPSHQAAPNKQEKSFAKKFGTALFHQTDSATAEIILRTQEMKPGRQGLAGGGIYFATTKELTSHKAHAHGTILKAYVSLGKILTLESGGDNSMTLGKLQSQGFDSVCIARQVSSGHEYVVYDPERVLLIERA